ncbi:type II toxin-antitoxin system death-on-curing family toxin [Pectobacterium versatile]|uniref:type II toxin-antitoxin system death-on-curing family toxin n=1 Tax=Pectobacterium versatile TaxID=2488639 RepID=UPI000B7BE82C|nr:type II toxin-antitoxin system death-on-curing family toxin [Pectobacterium versatile]ASN87633.1 Death-on-curing protein [Pectobacterium versatile]RJL59740.1 type II toxin-antitoxin system death-on-curing family toxin [Pectobacterium versatile]RJL61971.1 type II toxin-antitoxin system death-on-curing family toxin [Pectobacterium versatile]RJL63387.1 type II toxin-antitoxin system death-on-curing family toxin [Pectobacterium versatile]TAI92057.1 type II toxin-antitoxin system death-on-curing
MNWVSAQEVIAFHDRILQRLPGVAGMPDPGRAEAIIYRVQNRTHYEGITDVFELAATYWVAVARGHIFNDGNKRTAFFVTMTFLYRNGVLVRDHDNTLENLTVEAATGAKNVDQLAQHLRNLADEISPTR